MRGSRLRDTPLVGNPLDWTWLPAGVHPSMKLAVAALLSAAPMPMRYTAMFRPCSGCTNGKRRQGGRAGLQIDR
ncbi:MAG: hypothetical protein IPK27_11880 [Rhodanobacteraceae bacterium]|nr:hypothetical protein [Rhodanobacteraceae bacterium]